MEITDHQQALFRQALALADLSDMRIFTLKYAHQTQRVQLLARYLEPLCDTRLRLVGRATREYVLAGYDHREDAEIDCATCNRLLCSALAVAGLPGLMDDYIKVYADD